MLLAAALATQSLVARAALSTDRVGRLRRHRDRCRSQRRAARRGRRCACRRARWRCRFRWPRRVSCFSRGSAASSGPCSAASEATTGLSDEMSPGSISKLADRLRSGISRALRRQAAAAARRCTGAARCSTTSTASPGAGTAATYYPGARARDAGRAGPVSHHARAHPAAAGCSRSTPWTRVSRRDVFIAFQDRQLSVIEPITTTVSYDAVSLPAHPQPGGRCRYCGRRYETTLPPERNPRARALALELRARTGSDAEFARAVLDWFRDNGLEYTLEPGVTTHRLGGHHAVRQQARLLRSLRIRRTRR